MSIGQDETTPIHNADCGNSDRDPSMGGHIEDSSNLFRGLSQKAPLVFGHQDPLEVAHTQYSTRWHGAGGKMHGSECNFYCGSPSNQLGTCGPDC